MIFDLLRGEVCRSCQRDLSKSALWRVTGGIEKADMIVYPVLCACGGITVVGGEFLTAKLDAPDAAGRPVAS